MFMKRKSRPGKVYAYRMLVSFKTSVTYEKKNNFTLDNYVRSPAAFVGHDSTMPDTVRCPVLIFRPD